MAYWLSLHRPYACRHAGACCSSGWPIPLERVRVPAVAQAIADGRIEAPAPWILPVLDQPDQVAGVLAQREGRCVFHARTALTPPVHRTAPSAPIAPGGPCAVHGVLGHAALPAACQHFPRVCLIDDRGVSVTLSHYCPTAAALLASHDGPVTIVDGPDPVPGVAPEGLDARGVWPPLLAPGVLMDLESYAVWESHLVSWLGGVENADGRWSADAVLTLLDRQARQLAAWRPGDRSLLDVVHELAGDVSIEESVEPSWEDERQLRLAARASLPGSHVSLSDVSNINALWREGLATAWRFESVLVNRLLAAHAFASWTAYQGDGVRSQIRWLRLVLAVLREEAARAWQRDAGSLTRDRLVEAVRQTDLLLVHLVDRETLAAHLRYRAKLCEWSE